MICKCCGSSKQSKVLESRERSEYTYRRRKCVACGYEYMTYEKFVRGCKSIYGPRLLYPNELSEYIEAVWLELRSGTIIVTSVSSVSDNVVYFSNGRDFHKKTYAHMWRVWNKRPNDILREAEKWE